MFRLHIGHHFFGAGNLGDDLMMAGFLEALRALDTGAVAITCCINHDLDSQQLRFPEIEWHDSAPPTQERCIQHCDIWLGLGDSPFQSDVGPWLLDHLVLQTGYCKRFGKPMYFLGVGVNDRGSLQLPQSRQVLSCAERVWTRDALSAELLSVIRPGIVEQGRDLANIILPKLRVPDDQDESGVVGLLFNFEQSIDPQLAAIPALLQGLRDATSIRWLVQEVRSLSGSELDLYARLAPELRSSLSLRLPDYRHESLSELLGHWGTPGTMITSRYHGALTSAWWGAKLLMIRRATKLDVLAEELGVPSVAYLEATQALPRPRAPDPRILERMRMLALQMCADFFSTALPER